MPIKVTLFNTILPLAPPFLHFHSGSKNPHSKQHKTCRMDTHVPTASTLVYGESFALLILTISI